MIPNESFPVAFQLSVSLIHACFLFSWKGFSSRVSIFFFSKLQSSALCRLLAAVFFLPSGREPIFLNFHEFNTATGRLYIAERELSVFAGVIRYSIKSNGFKTQLSLINGHLDSIFKWAGNGEGGGEGAGRVAGRIARINSSNLPVERGENSRISIEFNNSNADHSYITLNGVTFHVLLIIRPSNDIRLPAKFVISVSTAA